MIKEERREVESGGNRWEKQEKREREERGGRRGHDRTWQDRTG